MRRGIEFYLVLAAFVVSASPTLAGGLWLFEDAGPIVGTAGAGRAAIANDAGTVRNNPAGMTRLKGSQMLVGAQPIVVDLQFDAATTGSAGGGDGGNAGGVVPSLAFNYVHDLSPDWKLGFGVFSFFGLGVEYDDDWQGRYYVQESEFLTVTAGPTIAYKVNDWLSVGGGVGLQVSSLDQKAAVNNSVTDPGLSDGRIEIDETSFAPVFSAAFLVEPRQGTRLGLTYTSEADHDFDDAASLSGIGPNLQASLGSLIGSNVDLEITLPQQVMFSVYQEVTPRLAIMGNVGWQDWSAFGETGVSITSSTATTLVSDRNFTDTWHFALGGQYRFGDEWTWSAGFSYDTSPVEDEDRTPDAPLDRQIRIGTGLQYVLSDNKTIGFAYEYVDGGAAPINLSGAFRGTLSGDYSSNAIHIANVNFKWKF